MRILVFTSWPCCSLVDIDTIAFHTSITPLLSTFPLIYQLFSGATFEVRNKK